jgi:hypothetical protein
MKPTVEEVTDYATHILEWLDKPSDCASDHYLIALTIRNLLDLLSVEKAKSEEREAVTSGKRDEFRPKTSRGNVSETLDVETRARAYIDRGWPTSAVEMAHSLLRLAQMWREEKAAREKAEAAVQAALDESTATKVLQLRIEELTRLSQRLALDLDVAVEFGHLPFCDALFDEECNCDAPEVLSEARVEGLLDKKQPCGHPMSDRRSPTRCKHGCVYGCFGEPDK